MSPCQVTIHMGARGGESKKFSNPPLMWAGQDRLPASVPYLGVCMGKERRVRIFYRCWLEKAEFRKPSPKWTDQDREVQHEGHIWAYVGGAKIRQSVRYKSVCDRGKAGV